MPRLLPSLSPRVVLAGLGVVLVLAYSIAWPGPFVFDDISSILGNASLRTWNPPWTPLVPPHQGGLTVGGRPLLNLTLAINYTLSGPQPWSFRVTNLAFHFASALLLAGIVRRAWAARRPAETERAAWMGVALAALWALHPLTTIGVNYVVQRAESLAALGVVATLYCFVRSTEPGASPRWRALAWLACLAGMATKESAAATPLLVILYDALFVAGGYAAAWRARRLFHLSLAATWLLLLALAWNAGGRGASAGFDSPVGPWDYALTQAVALVRYVRLAFWPHPLVFDYGTGVVTDPWRAALPGSLVLATLGLTVVGLQRRAAWGFFGAWFFLLLAPSSSFVPVATQTTGEHRAYLAIAAPLAALVCWIGTRGWRGDRIVLPVLGLVAAQLTVMRNVDYRSERTLWAGVVEHAPENARGHMSYATALAQEGKIDAALAEFATAAQLAPRVWKTRNNWGEALLRAGKPDAAREQLQLAHELAPAKAEPLINLGNVHLTTRRPVDAIRAYETALTLEPRNVTAYFNLGCARAAQGELPEAEAAFRRAVELQSGYTDAQQALGRVQALRAAAPPSSR